MVVRENIPDCEEGRDSISRLYWNRTTAGKTDVTACPQGTTGSATRLCSALTDVTPPLSVWKIPDLSQCINPNFQKVTETLDMLEQSPNITVHDVIDLAALLSNLTSSTSTEVSELHIVPQDITITTQALSRVADLSAMISKNLTDKDIDDLTNAFVDTVDNILDDANLGAWKTSDDADIVTQQLTSVVASSENMALSMARARRRLDQNSDSTTTSTNQSISFNKTNIEFDVVFVADSESDDSETMTFVRSGGSLSLPREVLNIANEQSSDQLAIYRARYPSLASLYSALEEESISRINTDVMATKILGIDEAFFKDLIEPVVGIYKHQELGANLNPSCVFLDLDLTSGEEADPWKATGCEVYASNETHTTCHCYHLTNFAVIMDVHGVQNQGGDSDSTTGLPVSEPLRIPDNVKPIDVDIKLQHPPSLEVKTITASSCEFGSFQHAISENEMYDKAWFMASFSTRSNTTSSATHPVAANESLHIDISQLTEPLDSQSPLTEQSSDDETSLHVHSDQNSDTQPEDEQSLESVTSGATFEHYLVSDIEQPMAMTTPSLDNSGGNSRVHGIEQSEGSTKTSEGPGVHSSAKALKKTVVPTWAATNSLLVQAQQKGNQSLTKSAIVAPLLRRPPTDYSSLFTILSLAQGISAAVVGPHKKTVITLDLDLYERATKLQSSTGNKNWILQIGELHACFASLHAIAKYLEDSGLESISIEAGLFSPSTIRQIFTGKWFKRGIEFHMTNIMACYDLLFEASVHHEHLDSMIKKCEELRKKLHERDSDIKQVFEEVTSMIKEHYQTKIIQENDEMATFLLNYMKQVESLLHVIRASRQGNWELHLASMEEQVKYYFAHDLYKYARLVPIYLLQMHLLKTSGPTTWDALKAGDFMVTKSGIPFTNLFVDQTLEQLIREVKVAGGITGITQNEEALGRFFLIAPELVILIQDFQDAYCCTTNDSQTTKEHYQLSDSVALRMHRNSSTIKKAIIRHCEGNPFEIRSMKLINI
eukprot:XP_011670960.1 PREDICTED: uncharacterized protein LOC105441514 [Strongylocentrotus purpuratus]